MPSLLKIKLSQAARSEGRAAVRIRRLADLQGNMDDTWVQTALRVGPDEERELTVEPGYFSVDTYGRNGRWTDTQAKVGVDETCWVDVTPERCGYRPVDVRSSRSSGFDLLTTDENVDEWKFVLDAKADAGRPTCIAKADEDGDVFIGRMDARGRHWVRYLRDGVQVIAAVPLGPENRDEVGRAVLRTRYRDLPAMAFGEEHPDVSVMADLLVCGSSSAEMYYINTFDQGDVLGLFDRKPFHFMTYALAQNGEPYGAGIPALIGPSPHDEWLPDMLIAQAHRRLHWNKYEQEHLDAAADLFLRSMSVGVPYFARSLRLLSDGLMILENTRPEMEEASRLVYRMSTRVYPEETFTTIRLDI
ncbi:hypothetical protein [Rhizobium leguminosarum]|uniref:hypothetical protein n=1 Tax=Rhizobium leguminosarum TaxID=384 RepID=UPI002E0DA708|nr:hypothetical protein U8Q02_40415 [Rhizobium leguminosarum]